MKEFDLISQNAKCSCRGYNLDKLIQPRILMVLATQDLHGYSIIQELENNYPFIGEQSTDGTGVYRALKTLEDKKMINFEWVLESNGPAKKKYQLTSKGLECLKNWLDTLVDYRASITKIITAGENILIDKGLIK